jgi:ABC-2 type transport system ATP-binding protein
MKMLRRFYSQMYPRWNEARYQHLQSLLQLDEKRKLSKFSKGMQKQAAFAFAMSIMPDVLLLDEPIDGLDPIVRKQVFEQIIEDVANRDVTVLISSHNLKEMDGICDAIGIIKKGRMVIERDLDDLKSDVHKVQLAFAEGQLVDFSGLNILHQEYRGIVTLLVVRGTPEEIRARVQHMNPLVYDHLPLTLEEIFIYETEGANDEIPY